MGIFWTTLVIFILGSLVSCQPAANKEAGPQTPEENQLEITFNNLKTHGNTLSYTVQGLANTDFDEISFHTSSSCSIDSRINSGDRSDLSSGMVLNLAGANTTHNLYYMASGSGVKSTGCLLLVNYTHDSVAPLAPNYTPASLTSQNGIKTGSATIVPLIASSYLPVDADSIKFYGNLTKTLFLGEIPRAALLSGSINLTLNAINNLYISFADLAGNESSLFNTGVAITNDSLSPVIPGATQPLSRNTSGNSVSITASVSGDTVSVKIINVTTNTTQTIAPGALVSGVSIPLQLNASNVIHVVALDDVGNESAPLVYSVVSDSIAPATPTLHTDTQTLMMTPVRGPSNTFKLLSNETGTISVYSDVGLTTLIASGTTSEWSLGKVINLLNSDGINTFYAVAIDATGNASSPLAISFMGDTTPPGEIGLTPSTLAKNNSYQKASQIALQSLAATDVLSVEVSGGNSVETYPYAQFLTGVSYTLNSNQVNTLIIKTIDLAGNKSSGQTLIINHDSVAPNFSITTPLNNSYLKQGGFITGTCEQQNVSLIVGGNFTVPCIAGSWQHPISNLLSHGVVLGVTASETDLAGNTTSVSVTFTVDNIAPVLTVDAATLPAVSGNNNHLIMGTCESGRNITLSGDSSGIVTCLAGFFVLPLSIATEGAKSFRLTQTDVAGNVGFIDFNLNFDFTPPAAVVLDGITLALHNTAISSGTFTLKGVVAENVPVKVYADASYTSLIGTYTQSDIQNGVAVNLNPDAMNEFFIVAEDQAGNKSSPAYLVVYHRLSLSKLYQTTYPNLNVTTDIGLNVDYKYGVRLTNESIDTNISKRIVLENITATSPTSQIVIDPTSECLTRSLKGVDSCRLLFTVKYTSVGSKNTDLTLTYPNGTTAKINVKHNVSVIAGLNSPNYVTTNYLFSNNLYETRSGESFITHQDYMDFGFNVYGATAISRRRRVQATSQNKIYMVCGTITDRLCVYDKTTPSLQEYMFSTPVISSEIENYIAAGIPNIDFWYIGSSGTKDILIVTKYKSSNYISQESALLIYDKATKVGVTHALTQGADQLSVRRPITGNSFFSNKVIFSGRHSLGHGLYEFDLTTDTLTKLYDLYNDSGYLVVKNKVIFSEPSRYIRAYDVTSELDVEIDYINSAHNQFICGTDHFYNASPAVEDRNEFSEASHHGIYFLCTASAKTKAIYTDGTDHFTLKDIATTPTDTLLIQSTYEIDTDRALFSLIRTGTNHIYQYYVDRTSNTLSSYQDSFIPPNYRPVPIYIDGKIYKQDLSSLVEYDLNFSPLRTLHNFGSSSWTLFRTRNTPFILNVFNKNLYYFDLEFNILQSYQSLSATYTGTITIEGFFRGFLYIRNGSGTTFVGRVPLYAK